MRPGASTMHDASGSSAGSHIHGNHGQRDEHLLPGLGKIRWLGVLYALRDIEYPGRFMYEMGRAEELSAVRGDFAALIG